MESSPQAQGDTKLDDLPEDVVCRILSCLQMRDVARVSPSCSAFHRASARYPRLTFDEDTLGLPRLSQSGPQQDESIDRDELANNFVRRADAIIASRRRHDTAALDALVVKFGYLRERDVPHVDQWVSFALTSSTTRLLRLDLEPHNRYNSERLEYDRPCSLLSAGMPAAAVLEHLYLQHGSLRLLPLSSGLTNLQSLVLSRSRVNSEDLDRLLSSCSLKLQSLKLKWCQDVSYIKVPPVLKILVVRSCWSMTRIDGMSGSSIESLRCDGRHMPAILLRGSTPSSLPAAKVTSARFNLQFLLDPVFKSQGADVEGSSSWLQLFSLARLMPGLESLSLNLVRYVWVDMLSSSTHCCSGNNRFSHLKRADIRMYVTGRHDDFLFLYLLLDAAPALETLSLDLTRYAPVFKGSRHVLNQATAAAGAFRKDTAGFPRHSLKVVDIFGFSADIASLELALYILDNAQVLQRMSLEPMWTSYPVDAEESDRLIREAIANYIAPAVLLDSGILLDRAVKKVRARQTVRA